MATRNACRGIMKGSYNFGRFPWSDIGSSGDSWEFVCHSRWWLNTVWSGALTYYASKAVEMIVNRVDALASRMTTLASGIVNFNSSYRRRAPNLSTISRRLTGATAQLPSTDRAFE